MEEKDSPAPAPEAAREAVAAREAEAAPAAREVVATSQAKAAPAKAKASEDNAKEVEGDEWINRLRKAKRGDADKAAREALAARQAEAEAEAALAKAKAAEDKAKEEQADGWVNFMYKAQREDADNAKRRSKALDLDASRNVHVEQKHSQATAQARAATQRLKVDPTDESAKKTLADAKKKGAAAKKQKRDPTSE